MKTIFCDIDGTILKHSKGIYTLDKDKQEVLPGVYEKFQEWLLRSYKIILTTARPESTRKLTEQLLQDLGITYHELIMNLPCGERILINDTKPDGMITARAYSVKRDKGIEGVEA